VPAGVRWLVVLVAALAFAPSAAGSGADLYGANCIECHGPQGSGIADRGPSLRGVGARAADFYLSTGYMPLGDPHDQPHRSRVQFTKGELARLVAYVASFRSGPRIPRPNPSRGSLSEGQELFTEHCAGCHQVVARGGVVTGARVPALTHASPVEVAEAVRSGPYVMPKFSKSTLSDSQLNSIISYVEYAKHPSHPGGWAIGYLGPVPEGMVVWLLATAALVAACTAIGRRLHE
jgi:ubiquinol-cytochrome c reductase cytochrome c subunit